MNKIFKVVICTLTILILSFPVLAEEKRDWLFTALTVALIMDCLQTNYIYDNYPNSYETNPILRAGMRQYSRIFIPLYFGSYYLAARAIAKSDCKYKKAVIGLTLLDESRFILRNLDLGVGLSFKFYF